VTGTNQSNTPKKIILCCGDSFMAGDELAMEEFYPEFYHLHPASTRIGELSRSKDHQRIGELFFRDPDKYYQYLEKCKSYTYPTILGNELNIPVINLAAGGQSNQTSATLTFEYLQSTLLEKYKAEEILVIFHLTSFDRIKVPNVHKNKYNNNCVSVILTFPIEEYADVIDFYARYASDQYLITDTAMHLFGLMQYCKTMEIDCVFTDSLLFSNSVDAMNNLSGKNYKKYTDILPKTDLIMNSQIDYDTDENVVCHFGHYSKEVHVRFGKWLAKKLKERFL
jgi:hypothetical protein